MLVAVAIFKIPQNTEKSPRLRFETNLIVIFGAPCLMKGLCLRTHSSIGGCKCIHGNLLLPSSAVGNITFTITRPNKVVIVSHKITVAVVDVVVSVVCNYGIFSGENNCM